MAAPLDEYRSKRDFATTPEPAGAPAGAGARGAGGPLSFVVHKHAARQLHYDVRLEVGGVLASWAVPKGPSLDPADKRLAVHVEDHPLEYGSFEGVIPAGEYGGGTVMVWDTGSFEPFEDPAAAIEKGHLKFALHGRKLSGAWALVRMKPRPGDKRENWLLIKERDDEVRPHAEYDVLAALPDSAASGRSMDAIAAEGAVYSGPSVADASGPDPPTGIVGSAMETDLPADAPFQLARLVERPPEGDEWIHEVKYDGYRLRVVLKDGEARVLTRNLLDWTDRFGGIARAVEALPVASAVLEGEAVAFDPEGRSDFGALQEALSSGDAAHVAFAAFDLLYLDGHDLRGETLLRRKELLRALVDSGPAGGPLLYVEHWAGSGPDFHASACGLLLEGSVSKRGDRPWMGGRTPDWRKAKCIARQEFVVVGYTDPKGARGGFGALVLGVHDEQGALRYAGKVGTGFTERELAELRGRLEPLASEEAPVSDAPASRDVHWVRPELVAEVAFREWTREGVVRQATFVGLRGDVAARDVSRERPEEGGGPAAAERAVASATPVRQRVAGVMITNPGKILDPAGISKRDLALYYEAVAPAMMPHLAGRLVTVVRCPHGEGTAGACFYQKHPEARGWPKTLRSRTVRDKEGPAIYFYVDDVAGLVSLAQLGCLEIHTWGSMASDPERPDRIVLDLDPGEGLGFPDVADAARRVRDALAAAGLPAFAKTTGGHGIHVVAPLVPQRGWEEVRAFAHALCARLAADEPQRFTDKMAKSGRGGRVFIDYLRNAHGATAVCAFSTRARPGAPVSVPVAWEELDGLEPARFDTVSVLRRLSARGADPWRGYDGARARLTDEMLSAVGVSPQR